MISWHRPGQMVVCKDASPWPASSQPHLLEKLLVGDVYTISRVIMGIDLQCRTLPGFQLSEIELPGMANYSADRFEPVRPTSIEQFKTLLNPSPETIDKIKDDDWVKEFEERLGEGAA